MNDILIRLYEKKDIDRVNKILSDSFNIRKRNFKFDNVYEVVAEINNIICGYLMLTKVYNPIKDKNYYLIDYVCVDINYRGLKIGDRLLEFAYEFAKKDNAIYLQLTCSFDRVNANKLYERCNFVKRNSNIYRKEIQYID